MDTVAPSFIGPDVKILCLTKNFKTQTPSGGYDQIATFLGADIVKRPVVESPPMRLIEKSWHYAFGNKPHLFSDLSHGYRFEDRLCEERAFWRAIANRPQIIHVLYGDWMLDTLLKRERLLSANLIATFHLPAEEVRRRFEGIQKHALQKLDGAVLLASNELNTYSDWLGPGKVTYIPHGVNIDVFRPVEFSPAKTARFLFVGMMLRDFETAHRVIDRCRDDKLDAEFIVVIPKAGISFFTGCTNVKIYSNISEEELISWYRRCDALFLPLLQSTANNAILEALACGVPIISTKIGGVIDYVDGSCSWLLPPSDSDSAYECVRSIIRDREVAIGKRNAARLRAETFSWERIATRLLHSYRQIRKTGRFAPDV